MFSNFKIPQEQALQNEVLSLKEDLKSERLKLQTQQDRVQRLEDELSVMQQLRQELDKEKELRMIAEDKLLELLDYEKRAEIHRKENEKHTESKSTQMDVADTVPEFAMTEKQSPLLYEGRLRKYQTYIAKLENDNLMLVNELKKFKDLSPRSQEEHAKVLVDKLGQMERNTQQQQVQYETCLDEVAHKLVEMVLVQQRLEEECKVLHLRVEQLEQENGTLMELIEDDKVEKVEKVDCAKVSSVPSSNSSIEHHKLSRHPITSSPLKKMPTSQKQFKSSEIRKHSSKSANASPIKKPCAEPRSTVTNPMSPGHKLGCASKIPSYGTSSRPLLLHKKSETDISLSKSRIPQNETGEPAPNSKPTSSSKSRLPSSAKGTKATSAKRKRNSRNGSPSDKGVKDSKQRFKSNHSRWDPRNDSNDDIPPPYNELSPIPAFPHHPQQVWSFNCEVNTNLPVPEIKRKIADSIEAFSDKLGCGSMDHSDSKQTLSASDSSTAIEGACRTRDEGYSTMSSDLQPDSVADTTISEAENSATYVITEKTDACNSDDSVTECLDGSMCSSSDSGFGPLYQVATLKFPVMNSTEEQPDRTSSDLPKFEGSSRTIKSKEQIASVKPTVRSVLNAGDQSQTLRGDIESNTICDHFQFDSPKLNSLTCSPVASPQKSQKADDVDISSPTKPSNENKLSSTDQSTMIDYWSFPKEILALKNYRKTWHLGPSKSIYDDQVVFCTRHSYIDDNLFDEKVETAEKATLTEPEEELWREKALAPFIDESIWSLYSSEGDIQIKHFPIEPLMSEPSLEKLITNCSPCIIVTQNDECDQSDDDDDHKTSAIRSSNNSSYCNLNCTNDSNPEKFRSGLERVASDTVLYLKDAIHELEDSMRRGLKSSKNIPGLHQNSGSESEASPQRDFCLKPEILRTLEATLREQNSSLAWTSPSRSSSLSSLQSSTSCHVISDEMEDVDIVHTSRKGSQDPDLSSASDAEYENLEHKDFVERWLQKEVVCNNNVPKMVPVLETVEEIGECPYISLKRKTSLPCDTTNSPSPISPRMRFKSFPADSNMPTPYEQLFPLPSSTPSSPLRNIEIDATKQTDNIEDANCLDPEAKEFNGDFYTLCSIGSNKSLDLFSPSKTRDMTLKQLVESPVFNRKSPPKSASKALPTKLDKPKPTGLVKPTRPLTLAVSSAPSVPRHTRQMSTSNVPLPTDKSIKKSLEINSKSKVPCIKSPVRSGETRAKINICSKVPLKNHSSVFQNDSNQCKVASNSKTVEDNSSNEVSTSSSLPASVTTSDSVVKSKSPTKIIFRNRSPSKQEDSPKKHQSKKDRDVARQNRVKEGCGTAWIHLQADPLLSDPSVRNTLLDSIKAPSSSSGSSSSEAEEEEVANEVLVIQTNSHLHRICKERRHKVKASANNPLYDLRKRSSIMGRRELFYRFGEKEKEAIACFDFLEKIPSASGESLNRRIESSAAQTTRHVPSNLSLANRSTSTKERISLQSPHNGDSPKMASSLEHPSKKQPAVHAKSPYSARQLKLPNLWNKPLGHNMSSSTLNSQDFELLDHISLSDSCAESYSSTPESYDEIS
ncbi:hypothetical protein JTE90_012871 [Oedothorax gibbosus]|uniref:Nck-associated protein 5 n=1 Tax=Oedothorax gibbosus TaxID=931172 RepID=A0AAV6UM66_9ARAC|nr:hypothetical protein JTE90_012871 [Oedothorax gibbosus]